MQCPQCHHHNGDAAKFCAECGAKLGLVCSACGAANDPSARFCQQCGAPLTSRSESNTSFFKAQSGRAVQESNTPPKEERRWVTVLFADLSSFTSLSEKMDPEDVKALAHRCAERMSAEVRRFDGTVISVAGDQIYAAFGAPVSHEDDAERAVRAALAIRDCPLSDNSDLALQVHVGINTGEVMAGLIGPEERRDYTVMGDTVNTAARLMSAAPAGSVLVGEETWRATRRTVRYRDLPPLSVKGKERPVAVWEALAATALSEARPLGSAPLLGRDHELSLLSEIWLRVVREARPQLITVIGEPGIGKSRIVAEFERQYCAGAVRLHGRCLPYGEALGYWALASMFKEAAEITAEDDLAAARAKLETLVTTALGEAAGKAGLAEELSRSLALLAGLDLPAERETVGPDQKALHGSIRRFCEALARRQPLVLMFEDIHWADDALLDLIEHIASRAREVPLLILTQARPDLLQKRPNWGGGVRAFTSLSLEPLSLAAAEQLVLALCRERGLPESAAEQAGRGAGGNPLFAEELVAMIAERGAQAGIPSAIKALIASRLDGLSVPERAALQAAAVFGKVFWESGLAAMGITANLPAMLEGLEGKDFVRQRPLSQFRGDHEYIFKHDLIRDVAYETLPRAERKRLHAHVADWMEKAAAESLDNYFDQLAHHALSAGQEERRLDYLIRAAEGATRRAAHRQAALLLGQAIAIAPGLGRPELLGDLHLRRGRAFMSVSIWAEARPEFESALRLLPPDHHATRAEILNAMAGASFWMFDVSESNQYAFEAEELAVKAGRDDLVATAIGWQASFEQLKGEMTVAQRIYRRAVQRDPNFAAAPLALFAHNLYLTGEIGEAVKFTRSALTRFRERNDTSNTMFAFPHLGLALAASGQYSEALQVFDEARRFGREYEVWPFLSRSLSMSAGWHLDVYDFAGHESRVQEAQEVARQGEFLPTKVSAGIDLLLNYSRSGQVGRAESLCSPVEEAAREAGGWHAWLWQIRIALARAEIACARGDWSEALRWASATIQQSDGKRLKYCALGLWTLARAHDALGRRHEAIACLKQALGHARAMTDPALFVRVASLLLELDGDDALARDAAGAVRQILAALPDEGMRRQFAEAEPVRRIQRFSG